ncbi:MAG TPA: hypothetical protein ENK18_04665 [Deltaproteobacteria bacterium]|nr:hypothetical protein [Deltaproteobacteria bacterium]
MRVIVQVVVLAGLVGGCTFVSRAEYEAQLLERDEDGDGVTIGEGDCDDADDTVYSGQTEIPYDGKDNDCLGDGDLVDVDEDGFIAVQAGGPDCRDSDPDVRPTAADIPYDGIDADCAANNDFDADGDGWIKEDISPSDVIAYQRAWNAVFELKYGDCDDFDATAWPGAGGEVPYDGIDTDCDGGDDFDADGDGYPIPDDCLDQTNPLLAVAPEEVYPGAVDLPYDGIDTDCGEDNDFDVDGDGYFQDVHTPDYIDYINTYGYDLDASGGDCDDMDPAVFPGALETLGDAIDRDCDEQVDGALFEEAGLLWEDPAGLVLETTSDHLILALSAARLDDGVNVLNNVVTTLVFDGHLGSGEAPQQQLIAVGPDQGQPLDAGVALASTGGSGFLVGSVDARSGGRTFTMLQEASLAGSLFSFSQTSPLFYSGGSFAPIEAELRHQSEGWLWSCGDTTLQATRATDLATASATVAFPVTGCFTDSATRGTACGTTECTTFDFDPSSPTLTLAPTQPWGAAGWRHVHRHGSLIVAADPSTGASIVGPSSTVSILGGEPVLHLDAVASGGLWLVAAITEPASAPRGVVIGYGPAGGPIQTVPLDDIDPLRPGLVPLEVAIAASSDRVMLAITLDDNGSDDVLAWSVYEHP